MDPSGFGYRLVQKQGWDKGRGLGRKESGIKEAIKVKIKNDVNGLGFDPGKEFTQHWWEQAYNKAAEKITVEDEKNTGQTKPVASLRAEPSAIESVAKSVKYGNFVKTATLHSDGSEEVKNSTSEPVEVKEEKMKPPALCDEKILEMCEGRTANRAARHGLQLNGKLLRLQQQERDVVESSVKGCKIDKSLGASRDYRDSMLSCDITLAGNDCLRATQTERVARDGTVSKNNEKRRRKKKE